MEEIGEEDVDVPKAFYKIVVRKEGQNHKILAFLFPHKESSLPLQDFLISVDRLEAKTGLDFFDELNIELAKEQRTIDLNSWAF